MLYFLEGDELRCAKAKLAHNKDCKLLSMNDVKINGVDLVIPELCINSLGNSIDFCSSFNANTLMFKNRFRLNKLFDNCYYVLLNSDKLFLLVYLEDNKIVGMISVSSTLVLSNEDNVFYFKYCNLFLIVPRNVHNISGKIEINDMHI